MHGYLRDNPSIAAKKRTTLFCAKSERQSLHCVIVPSEEPVEQPDSWQRQTQQADFRDERGEEDYVFFFARPGVPAVARFGVRY
jgi:hypothetical protein